MFLIIFMFLREAEPTRKIYEYQKFVCEYERQARRYQGLLVHHGLGSGKTYSAIELSGIISLSRSRIRQDLFSYWAAEALFSGVCVGRSSVKNSKQEQKTISKLFF